jgi:GNAT superfamily N-acetyltransferase
VGAKLLVAELERNPNVIATLSEILIETVAGGGSVWFMHPVAPEAATAFWEESLQDAERGGRILLGAWDDGQLVGTVSLILCPYPNQLHRAEIAKMMTRVSHRRRGVATALLEAAEREALERGRTLLVLDTAEIDGAGPLYERMGYLRGGSIPDYALLPHGGLTATVFYWKRIGGGAGSP